jgi:hypothetical protein
MVVALAQARLSSPVQGVFDPAWRFATRAVSLVALWNSLGRSGRTARPCPRQKFGRELHGHDGVGHDRSRHNKFLFGFLLAQKQNSFSRERLRTAIKMTTRSAGRKRKFETI